MSRITETANTIETSEKEVSDARSKTVECQNRMAQLKSEGDSLRQTLQRQSQESLEAQNALKAAEGAEKEQSHAVQNLQNNLLRLEGVLARLNNQLTTLDRQRTEFENRVQKLNSEKVTISDERQKVSHRLESLRSELNAYKGTFEASRHAVVQDEGALRELEHHCQHLAERISELQRLLSEKTSRRDVLRQLQESYEGYSDGLNNSIKPSRASRNRRRPNKSQLTKVLHHSHLGKWK
jgi:chromosome segregation protein